MAAGGTTVTRTAEKDDKAKLIHVLNEFLDVEPGKEADHDAFKALQAQGIELFSDFLTLHSDDLSRLKVPPTTSGDPEQELGLIHVRKLIITIHFYHHICISSKGDVDIRRCPKALYDHYRTSTYEPGKRIVPWKKAIADGSADHANGDLVAWKKNIRPTQKDYPTLKDDLSYVTWL